MENPGPLMAKIPDDFLQSLNARSQDIFRKIVER